MNLLPNGTKGLLLLLLFFAGEVSTSAATYYIDFVGGSDTNDGMTNATSWQHQPYMQGFTGNYVHVPGDQFIFKGGVTWDHTCLPVNIAAGGSAGNNDYYGVDQTWYSGPVWSRPVFNGGYADTTGKTSFFVVATNNFITFDNLEMTQLMGDADFTAMIYGGQPVSNLLIENCYFHGWRCNVSTDSAHGAVILNQAGFTVNSVVVQNCLITNAENIGAQNGVALRMVQTIEGCTIHDVSSAVLFTSDFDGCSLYNVSYPSGNQSFDPSYHTNGVYLDNGGTSTGISSVRNSTFSNISSGANTIYLNPHGGQHQFAYNNLIYGVQSLQLPIEIDTYNYGGGPGGTVYCYNNTIVSYNDNDPAIHIVTLGPDRPPLDLLVAINNHVIYPTSGSLTDAVQGANVTAMTASNNILQMAATANAQGYTLANFYQPTAGGWTIHAGIPESGLFTYDILGASRPQATPWDVGAYEYVSPSPSGSGRFKERNGTTSAGAGGTAADGR